MKSRLALQLIEFFLADSPFAAAASLHGVLDASEDFFSRIFLNGNGIWGKIKVSNCQN